MTRKLLQSVLRKNRQHSAAGYGHRARPDSNLISSKTGSYQTAAVGTTMSQVNKQSQKAGFQPLLRQRATTPGIENRQERKKFVRPTGSAANFARTYHKNILSR